MKGKKRDYRPVTVKEDGEEEKERKQLSGVWDQQVNN
jgi:hypothetical protein